MLRDLDLRVSTLIHVADYLLLKCEIANFLNMFADSNALLRSSFSGE